MIDGLRSWLQRRASGGLRKGFIPGEHIAWKGIWFQVVSVKFDRIELRPSGMTWKRSKQIEEGRNGR